MGWTVVVPVKPLATAKTRLRGQVKDHELLVLAFALDTVAAALTSSGVDEVVVVTDDTVATQALEELGVTVVPDKPGTGLNGAILFGASLVPGHPVAALTADLPALTPGDLGAALRAAAGRRCFVADTPGTGTTLLTALDAAELDPRFGPDSAAAHTASGAAPLVGTWATLRRDVDTPADLAAARALGLGAHTSVQLGVTVSTMQGTVATYDPDTRSGTLLLDNGTEITFDAAAFDAGGLRLLRLGQRLRIEHDGTGRVDRITLLTLP